MPWACVLRHTTSSEGHMGSLTDSFFWAECGYRTLCPQVFPDPQGPSVGHSTLPAGPSPITSSVLLPCPWLSVPCYSPRFSLFHFPNFDLFSSPNLLPILLPCISLCCLSPASLLLAYLSPGLLTALLLHHSPPTSLSCLFPSNVIPLSPTLPSLWRGSSLPKAPSSDPVSFPSWASLSMPFACQHAVCMGCFA